MSGCLTPPLGGAVDDLSARASSLRRGEASCFLPTNPPDAAPAVKISAASTTVRRKRRGRDRAVGVGATPGRLARCSLGRVAGTSGSRGLVCSRGSGSIDRARSARTSSTSASSGLIGPRISEPPGAAPSGWFGSSIESWMTSDRGVTPRVLQDSTGRPRNSLPPSCREKGCSLQAIWWPDVGDLLRVGGSMR